MVGIEKNINSLVRVAPAGRESSRPDGTGSQAASAPAQATQATASSITQAAEAKKAQGRKEESTLSRQLDRPLDKAAEVLESYIPDASPNVRLRIDQDEGTGRFIYQGIDKESGEVVNQFPPEQVLKFIKKSREIEGLILDTET